MSQRLGYELSEPMKSRILVNKFTKHTNRVKIDAYYKGKYKGYLEERLNRKNFFLKHKSGSSETRRKLMIKLKIPFLKELLYEVTKNFRLNKLYNKIFTKSYLKNKNF